MGLPMATHAAHTGHRVFAVDIAGTARRAARAVQGIEVVPTPADAAERAPVVFTCLPSANAVRAVYLGDAGIVASARPGLLTCDCSTIDPAVAGTIRNGLEARGARHLDAPIFGVPKDAQDAQIFFAVSGRESDAADIAPLLRAMSRGHRYVGGGGTACTIKALQNGLGNAHAVATGEVLALCKRLGLDVTKFIDVVIEAGGLGCSKYFEAYALPAAQGTDSGGGRLHIGAKDAALARDLARQMSLDLPILEAAADAFAAAMDAGWAGGGVHRRITNHRATGAGRWSSVQGGVMEISCAFAPTLDTPDHVMLAEELGFRRAWVFDTPAVQLEVWSTLALAAVRTERIELGAGVLIPGLRHVMVTASGVATLAGLAPNRFVVGLGTGFSARFALGRKPHRWDFVAEYTRQLKGLLAGETVEVDGAQIRMLHGKGQAPARPLRVPIVLATAGPRGEAVARELADGIFTVIPVRGFAWQAHLVQGTVLDPGESFDSPRVLAAAGAGASVVFHRAWDRPAPGRPTLDQLEGGREWREHIESIDPKVRHLHTHEGHLTFLNDIDRKVINGDLVRDLTFSGEAEVLRARIDDLGVRGVTEIAFQPAGPDVPRELQAFARMAGVAG